MHALIIVRRAANCPSAARPRTSFLAVLAVAAMACRPAAASFGPVGGSLTARAGDEVANETVEDYVITSISAVSDQGPFIRGLASVLPTIVNDNQFDFELQATSTTTEFEPNGNPNSSVSLFQTVDVAETRRGILFVEVGSSGNGIATVAVTGPGVSMNISNTSDQEITLSEIINAGTYTVAGSAQSAAVGIGTHTGSISGSFLLTNLADLDGDLQVSGSDFLRIQAGFGRMDGNATFMTGDVNDDQFVTAEDFTIFEAEYGPVAASPAIGSVPEPGSLLLAAVGAACCCFRRRI